MTLPPREFVELRDLIRIHMKQMRKLDRKPPIYAAALVVAVGCEALATALGRAKHEVFAWLLRPRVSSRLAKPLFFAIRHGLAHAYDTSLLAVQGGPQVVVVLTWKSPSKHLTIRTGDWLKDGKSRQGLHVDVESLFNALERVFRRMQRDLQDRTRAKDFVRERRKALWHVKVDARLWNQFTRQIP